MEPQLIDFGQLQVDKANSQVFYNDKLHKYWTKDTQQNCVSVTTLIHQFTSFDEEFWSKYKTLELLVTADEFKSIKPELLDTKKFKSEYYDRFDISGDIFENKRTELLREWEVKRETSCIRGTAIHREQELLHLAGKTKEVQQLELGGKFTCNTSNIIEPGYHIYPELLLSRISDDGKLRLAGQADLVIVDNYDVLVLDYKGLPLDTPILTTNGFKLLKNLTKKDTIFDVDGNETNIINISAIHSNPCYKITFDNGESIIADHEHKWPIAFAKGKGKFKEVILTTEEVKNALEVYKENGNSCYLPKILNPKPLQTSKTNLPIDPYIFGYWLGDGTSAAGTVTAVNQNFWAEVIKRGYTYGNDISGESGSELRTIFGLVAELRSLNVLNNKHIPASYLTASYDQRLELLRGFMDADGYYNKTRKRFVMATTRKYQADYLIALLATLGVKPSLIYAKKYCNGKVFDGWDVCFTMKENPFLIRNQEGIEFPKTDKASFRVVKSVEQVETIPTQCLEVDSPTHTFLAGHSLLPTHNTNAKIEAKSFFDRKTKKSVTLKYPLNHIQDSNFWHYTLQLSTYAWMIQKHNPKFNIKLLMLIHYDHSGGETNYECEYLKNDVEKMLAFYKKQIEHEEFKKSRTKIEF